MRYTGPSSMRFGPGSYLVAVVVGAVSGVYIWQPYLAQKRAEYEQQQREMKLGAEPTSDGEKQK
eukprot:CAMPEP_0177655836 /NCGR_PEP_ID=MMETSP0447-20121125/15204_1 /TAXON_ID=0 /ORGANISM="Stygamoeba regulata, Strain BSH-02190019" /LENGTH=63 /DNA_ID=CAMNT_0019159831 /DNA_START=27 /DNA_END=218 /DNA_ORIENTATION=+